MDADPHAVEKHLGRFRDDAGWVDGWVDEWRGAWVRAEGRKEGEGGTDCYCVDANIGCPLSLCVSHLEDVKNVKSL